MIKNLFIDYLFITLILVYKMCKNFAFGKQNDGITRFLESCTWWRHSL